MIKIILWGRMLQMARKEEAVKLFKQGYNCAQAVLLVFRDVTGLDKETSLKLGSSFGGGLGRLGEVCGAVSGMLMVAGLLAGYTEPKDKEAHYQLVLTLVNNFMTEHDTLLCRDLLAKGMAGKKSLCTQAITTAVELVEELLLEKG
jgi:C_GCAxxG_C_C family probable redox protein